MFGLLWGLAVKLFGMFLSGDLKIEVKQEAEIFTPDDGVRDALESQLRMHYQNARTIFVPPSTPVILREDLEKVKVWILDTKTQAYYAGEKTLYRGQHVLSYDKIEGPKQ